MRNAELRTTLELAREDELEDLKIKIQEAFGEAVVKEFGQQDGPIPDDEDLNEAFHGPDAVVYHLVESGHRIGGVVLSIHTATQYNSLDFFFVSPEYQNKGFGYAAWKAIEEKYPDTKIWQTVTPYFEKRNIHFYVNCCGFKIVAFWNQYYPDPHGFEEAAESGLPVGCDELFCFEKVMG